MQINISARHGHLSTPTQDKITEKVEPLRKFFDRMTAMHVVVDLEHRESPTVELRISAEHHEDFVAIDKADNALAALDSVVEKIEQQLRKHKDKLKEHRATGHKHLDVPASELE